MNWQLVVQMAEAMANAASIPSSLEIITLIKKVNPTKLRLSESDRVRGYEAKAKLQNLLLENYGKAFYLAPHPYCERITLIKHMALPSIDACHADLNSLSVKALDSVDIPVPKLRNKKVAKKSRQVKAAADAAPGCPPKEALKNAQRLIEEFEYAQAEAVLTGIRIASGDDLAILEKAVRMLALEMGGYERAIETMLAQPKQILKEKSIRELLALTYHQNGMLPEARVIFDSFHPHELGKEALYAYADLSFKDGRLSHAFNLMEMADEMEGYVAVAVGLRKDVETGMLAEAEPLVQRALTALGLGDSALANSLAREVLEYYPKHQRAREIVALLGSDKEATEIAGLWEQYSSAQRSEEKIDLLTRLLEHDKQDKERLRTLIAEEKACQKNQLVGARLRDLRRLADQADWPACYPILHWLSAQKDYGDEYREACTISPYFAVLYRNRQLRMLPERTSKQLWLDFVKAKSSLLSGEQGCFESMEAIKEYFLPYPEFRVDYLMLLEMEQKRARREIGMLLQQAEDDAGNDGRPDRSINEIRKKMAVLPAEERCEYGRRLELLLSRQPRFPKENDPVQAYREALLIGNACKAASLRARTDDPATLEAIDAEIGEMFRIEASEITIAISDDLPFEPSSAAKLTWHASTDRHLLFWENETTLVIVNPDASTATRFVSERFKYLFLSDAISERDTFLFLNRRDATAWRAELSAGKGAFTATFDLMEKLMPDTETLILGVYLSSDKTADYYVNMGYRDGATPGMFFKRRLGVKNGASHCVQLGDNLQLYSGRASSEPDLFIVGGEDDTRIYNQHLKLVDGVSMTPEIWEVDAANGHIYYFYSHQLKRVNFLFENRVEFENSSACYFFKKHKVLGLCPDLDTVMVSFRERAAFSNYRTGMVSDSFVYGSVVCTRPARKYYCYDYCSESRKITLRDITRAIGTLLEWEEFDPDLDGERGDDWLAKMYRQIYFGYQPEPVDDDGVSETDGGEGVPPAPPSAPQ